MTSQRGREEGRSVCGRIVLADNLAVLRGLPDGCVHLAYADPPFNTGLERRLTRLRMRRSEAGDRIGFGGRRYRSEALETHRYADRFEDYLGFLRPRLAEMLRVLRPDGSLFLHVDWRESHRCRLLMEELLGPRHLRNEIVWAYDFGGRPRNRWPAKHDTILWYVKDPRRYTFRYDDIDRIPYMAPRLVGPAKAARGKTPTDVWWHTIVPTSGRERTGYPTQKPLGVLRRIVAVHSNPGDLVLDGFAGSGTTGEAAARLGRDFLLIDNNPQAVRIMARRLAFARPAVEAPAKEFGSAGP